MRRSTTNSRRFGLYVFCVFVSVQVLADKTKLRHGRVNLSPSPF